MLNLSRFVKALTPSLAPLVVSVALFCADAALAEETARTGFPQQLCQVGAERVTPEAARPNRPSGERPSAEVVHSLDRSLRGRDEGLYLEAPHPAGEKADLRARKHDSESSGLAHRIAPHKKSRRWESSGARALRGELPGSPVNGLKNEWDSQSFEGGFSRPPPMQHPLPLTGKGPDVIEGETHETHETHDMAHEKREEAEPRCHFNAETGRCESYDNK